MLVFCSTEECTSVANLSIHPSSRVFICLVQKSQRVYLDDIKLKDAHSPAAHLMHVR